MSTARESPALATMMYRDVTAITTDVDPSIHPSFITYAFSLHFVIQPTSSQWTHGERVFQDCMPRSQVLSNRGVRAAVIE